MLLAMWLCCPFHKIWHNFFVPGTWAQSSDMLWPMKLGPSDNVLVPHTVEPVEPEAGSTSFFSMGWAFPDTSACVKYVYRADLSAVCSEELNPIRPTTKAEFPAKPSLDYLVFCQTINGWDCVISSISISQSLKVVGYTARTDRYNTEKTNEFSDLKIFLTSSSNSSFPIYNLTEIPMKIQQKVTNCTIPKT